MRSSAFKERNWDGAPSRLFPGDKAQVLSGANKNKGMAHESLDKLASGW